MTDVDIEQHDYPVAESVNVRDVDNDSNIRKDRNTSQDVSKSNENNDDLNADTTEQPSLVRRQHDNEENTTVNGKSQEAAVYDDTNPNDKSDQRNENETDAKEQTDPTGLPKGNDNDDEDEYVIDRIVSHGINEDNNHPSAKPGETVYRVRWYGYSASDDTYEPIRHLPRNKVVSYYKRKRLALPTDIGKAQLG
ncbi:MAG: chromo domain-containing protein [Pseudomonadota bacterium]